SEAGSLAECGLVGKILAELATGYKLAVEMPELRLQARGIYGQDIFGRESKAAEGLRSASATAADIGEDLATKREGKLLRESVFRISGETFPDGIATVRGGVIFVGIEAVEGEAETGDELPGAG